MLGICPSSLYYSSLESLNVNMSKNPNLIIFLDWDDTCLPSSILDDYGLFSSRVPIPNYISDCLKKCEEKVHQILLLAQSLTDHVYIITNSTNDWVSYSIDRFYPILQKNGIVDRIPIFYARVHESTSYDPMVWKYLTMVDILDRVIDNRIEKESKIKVISIGDSIFERNALRRIGRERKSITTKVIKMLEFPETIDHLYTQLVALTDILGSVMTSCDPCDLVTSIDMGFASFIQNIPAYKSIESLDEKGIGEPKSQGLDGWHYKWAEHWNSHYNRKSSESNDNHNVVKSHIFPDRYRYGLDMIDEREKREYDSDDSDSCSDSCSDLNQTISDLESIDLNSNDTNAMDLDP